MLTGAACSISLPASPPLAADAPWVPPGRFYLDKAASDATSPQRKRALSAARLQGRQWEREAAASPLRRVPSPSQGQGGVKGSVQLRGMGSGSPQRQWGLDASSRQHLVSRCAALHLSDAAVLLHQAAQGWGCREGLHSCCCWHAASLSSFAAQSCGGKQRFHSGWLWLQLARSSVSRFLSTCAACSPANV